MKKTGGKSIYLEPQKCYCDIHAVKDESPPAPRTGFSLHPARQALILKCFS